MSGFAGRRLRVQIDFGSGFVNVGGAQTDGMTINKEPIDVTDKDDTGIRRYLAEIGTHSVDLSIEGVLKDTELLQRAADSSANVLLNCRVMIASLGTMTGDFALVSFEPSGAEGAEALTFTASLQSSGAIAFAAIP